MKTRQLYQVIWGYTSSELSEKVNNELKYGWKLSGGVSQATSVTLGQSKLIYIQAVYQDIPSPIHTLKGNE